MRGEGGRLAGEDGGKSLDFHLGGALGNECGLNGFLQGKGLGIEPVLGGAEGGEFLLHAGGVGGQCGGFGLGGGLVGDEADSVGLPPGAAIVLFFCSSVRWVARRWAASACA